MTIISTNKKARFLYSIYEEIECGIILSGSEVKSIRNSQVNLNDSHAGPKDGDLYLFNLYIAPYRHACPLTSSLCKSPRKLLLHRKQINKLLFCHTRNGMTLVPLQLYFSKRGFVKVLLGVCQGRKIHDKRELVKKRDWNKQREYLLKVKIRNK